MEQKAEEVPVEETEKADDEQIVWAKLDEISKKEQPDRADMGYCMHVIKTLLLAVKNGAQTMRTMKKDEAHLLAQMKYAEENHKIEIERLEKKLKKGKREGRYKK